jgi:hypothetical protein
MFSTLEKLPSRKAFNTSKYLRFLVLFVVLLLATTHFPFDFKKYPLRKPWPDFVHASSLKSQMMDPSRGAT